MKLLIMIPMIFLTAACAVEVKDKNEKPPEVKIYGAADNVIWNEARTLDKPETIKAHRLTIRKNAIITTGEHPLIIQVDELIAEGGTIQNFSPNAQAGCEANGRSGGAVQIDAKYATGNLNVLLNGENGGQGKNGAITDPRVHPGCAGTSGGDGGNAGSLQLTVDSNSGFTLNWDNIAGMLGMRGLRGSVRDGTAADTIFAPCGRDVPDGVDGKAGRKGLVCLKMSASEDRICE
ncbi:hypothetical protein [Bdellovibrio sp. KM01]|uniref:hypothetical protein n=1 Tax=Bdellovibrio sp. KM01 TaxID=2748865 RepID=UPI0015E97203|nr:hypothetical protein [Bdellovibrio sp. KM01]QLY25670.1 hypothetical protein HW988_01055 [Bdellovibrio sp. KM01]